MSLYNLKVYPPEELNMEAHPGGGTEVVEVPSFEGLVEDLYETQRRILNVALKEPAMARIAMLAKDLEGLGFISTASSIDDCLYKIADITPEEEIKKLLNNAINSINNTRFNLLGVDLDFRNKSFDSLLSFINKIKEEISRELPDFNKIAQYRDILLSDEVLYGSWSKVHMGGDIDLESWMTIPDFNLYKDSLEALQVPLMNLKNLKTFTNKDESRERKEDQMPEDELYELRTQLKSALDTFNKADKEIASLLDNVYGEDEVKAKQIIKSHNNQLVLIGRFKKNLLDKVNKAVFNKEAYRSVLIRLYEYTRGAYNALMLVLNDLRNI